MQKNSLIKRYFLRYITSIFAVCFLSLVVAASAVAVGVYRLSPDRLDLAPLSMVGVAGLTLILTILHVVVARLLVNYNLKESGLYFRVKDGKVDAANPQWGKDGVWVSLPRTDQPHEIGFPRYEVPIWSEPIVLKVFFRDVFNPQEVYEKVFAVGYGSFDLWLRDRFLAAVAGSPVQDALRLTRQRSSDELEKALLGLEFSGGLENIGYVEATATTSVTVRF